MNSRRARLEILDQLEAPDLWLDALRIEPAPEMPTSPPRRWATIIVALLVGAAGVALVAIAFSGARPKTETPRSTLTPTPVENGPIWALGGGGEAGSLIYAVDPATGQKTPLWSDGRNPDFPNFPVAPDHVGAEYDYAFSPDGSRVAFAGFVNRGSADCCRIELFVMNADGTGLTQLTRDNAYISFPSWSPDDSELVFSSYRGTHYIPGCQLTGSCHSDLYVIGADGTGEHQLTDDAADEATPTWSPDGTKIAYVYAEGGSHGALWVMNADGTGSQNLIASDGAFVLLPEWSPNGSQILYLSATPGERFAMWVANADGTDPHQLIDTNADTTSGRPVWSPDGTKIAYAKLVNGEPQLWVMKADGSEAQLVAELPGYGISPVAWQPLLVSSPAPTAGAIVPVVTARVADTIDIGPATSVAYGAGSVWVAVDPPNGAARAIIRIDPESDKIVATISTSVVPGWEIGGGGLVVADGSVWVAGLDAANDGTQGAVVRIDPSTNQVADTITLKEGQVADVAVDPGAIWALLNRNAGPPEVVRIDPSTDQVVATIPLNGGYGRFLFAEGSSVFAAVAQPRGGPFVGGTLVRIDPSTNQVAGTFELGTYPSAAAGDGSIWAITDSGLVQIDPTTGQSTGAPAHFTCTGDALAVGAGGVWCFDPARDRALERFNPETTDVDVVMRPDQGTGGTALATSPGSIWVVNGEQLTRIDLG